MYFSKTGMLFKFTRLRIFSGLQNDVLARRGLQNSQVVDQGWVFTNLHKFLRVGSR